MPPPPLRPLTRRLVDMTHVVVYRYTIQVECDRLTAVAMIKLLVDRLGKYESMNVTCMFV